MNSTVRSITNFYLNLHIDAINLMSPNITQYQLTSLADRLASDKKEYAIKYLIKVELSSPIINSHYFIK